uniref:Uncharacterized protein n=1 Tax=Arundo donax TaxID=35708 RepID=A0A0A9BB10_ARUDO
MEATNGKGRTKLWTPSAAAFRSGR